ncbi:GrpB family protein [Petroclostridium sp. X23]|uniref:GrpB family protein n=1 Tax=Petroclostridium sp. X23 TaxID=3045146 RepID=UPI0024AD4235|nr:GrpB family protein [Petroclostridium sp. X23]WHH61160.1 GrpB family protein [Petroclostridium sp. X23]
MEKPLNEMTNEELWRLFPIILSEHMPIWKENYLAEKTVIEQAVGQHNIVRINHYGSTSVPDLIAKPTIDILLEITENMDIEKLKWSMRSIGYIYSEQPNNPAPHMMFMKGYTPRGFEGQVFHVHVRYSGDWDELYFRDYLLTHPEVSDKYGRLKIELQKKYEHDRDGYTDAKTDFINRIAKLARLELKNRD